MQTHLDKNQENRNEALANSVCQEKTESNSAFQFVDNRPEASQMRKLKEMASNYIQKKAFQFVNNRPATVAHRNLQEMANSRPLDKQIGHLKIIKDNHFEKQPIQCRFIQDGIEYSFLSAFDINGNPYLASKHMEQEKNWKIKNKQSAVQLEEVGDLYETVTDENRDSLFHNLSMGREQRVNFDGQKAILNPFKTYNFGAEKVPDVSVFNIDENGAEPGLLYPFYSKTIYLIKKQYQDDLNLDLDFVKKSLSQIKSKMMPLILSEEYRTRGAIDLFEKAWNNLIVSFAQLPEPEANVNEPDRKRQKSKATPVKSIYGEADKALSDAINKATVDLPWAGTGGKQGFRSSNPKVKDGYEWKESKRPIDRREVSPERDDVGGKWEDARKYPPSQSGLGTQMST